MSDTSSKFAIHIPGTDDGIAVESFYAEEGISSPFSVNVNVVSESQLEVAAVVGSCCSLTICDSIEDRLFHGVIHTCSFNGETGRFYNYQMTIVPYLWLMGLNKNYRIFQNLSTVDIARELLKGDDLYQASYEFRLTNEYPRRRFCVQYGESDLRFLSRLFEEEGIFYFFEHTAEDHRLIVSDSEVSYRELSGASEIGVTDAAGLVPDEDVIEGLSYHRSICPGKVSLKNYNFKRPSLDMTVVEEGEGWDAVEVYDYPGAYGLPSAGKQQAKARLQERAALQESAQGTSNVARFIPGSKFSVPGHCLESLTNEYCLVKVAHSGSQSNVYGEYSGIGGDYHYSNSFLAIPSSVTFRPERSLEKPSVSGLQSAVVVGPPGEEIYSDEYGRVKVRFHWDRQGLKDENSSCWLRVSQPWSGRNWGLAALPRVGDEVLVDFINGDPDWPIVVGSVNNAESPALYPLPAQRALSGIRTSSYPEGGRDNFHELRFDDRKGREEIYLQSERDWNILVKHDQRGNIGNDSAEEIGRDKETRAGRNIRIEAGDSIELVCGAASIRIDSHGTITMKGTDFDICGSEHIRVTSEKIDMN